VIAGAMVGAAAGAVWALVTPEFACGLGDENCLFSTTRGTLIGAGMGAGVGSLIGLLLSRTR
jgi:H+/Cl- antiporter ClcA